MNTRLLRGIRNVSATALILIAWTTVVTTRAAEGDTVASQLREKGFEQSWIDSLTQKGTPRVYSGDELRFIGQPVGGLFAGQLYMGGDGRLWYWDLFNKRVMDPGGPGDKYYNAPMHPDDFRTVSSGFALEVDDRAVPLDGRGFDSVEFRGQYPIAKATFSEKDLPVKVRL